MWYVVDPFGFAWSDALETLEEARQYLQKLRNEPVILSDGTQIEFEIERRD